MNTTTIFKSILKLSNEPEVREICELALESPRRKATDCLESGTHLPGLNPSRNVWYQNFQRYFQGKPAHFGSFHSLILKAYIHADSGNRKRLEFAFPGITESYLRAIGEPFEEQEQTS